MPSIALADLLASPEYVGRNLDAFNDGLSDVEGAEVLAHRSALHLCTRSRDSAAGLIAERTDYGSGSASIVVEEPTTGMVVLTQRITP